MDVEAVKRVIRRAIREHVMDTTGTEPGVRPFASDIDPYVEGDGLRFFDVNGHEIKIIVREGEML